jgi:flagellar biogenesis protein FliO
VNTWDIVQIFLILGLMMGMMYGMLFFAKKYMYSHNSKNNTDSKIQVLSTQTILPKRFVSVIKYNNSVYLLGVSDQSVNLIDKLNSDELEADRTQEILLDKPNFLQLLKNNMGIK